MNFLTGILIGISVLILPTKWLTGQSLDLTKQYGIYAQKELANGIVADSEGNIYSIGTVNHNGSVKFDSLSHKGHTFNPHFIVVKQDPNGNAQWIKTTGTPGPNLRSEGNSIAIDHQNNIYIAGQWSGGQIYFEGFTFEENYGVWLAKINPQGITEWVKVIDVMPSYTSEIILNVTSTGKIHLLSGMKGSAVLGNLIISPKSEEGHFFIASYDSSGTVIWAKAYGALHVNTAEDITSDETGNIYISGSYNYLLEMDTVKLNKSGDYNVFIAKLDSNGKTLWAKDMPYQTYANSRIAADNIGNTYFGVVPHRGGFLHKIDPDGNDLWEEYYESMSNYDGKMGDITVDNMGNPYFTGSFYGSLEMGPYEYSGSFFDFYLAGYHQTGGLNYIRYFRRGSWDFSNSLYVGGKDNSIYICGSTSDDRLDEDYLVLRYKNNVITNTNDAVEQNTLFPLSPNPVNENFKVTLPASEKYYSIRIINMFGQELFFKEGIKSEELIERNNLPDGLYTYQIATPGGLHFSEKILLK